MEIKTSYIVIAFIVLLIASFWGGWIAACRNTRLGTDLMAERISNYETELKDYGDRQGELTDALRWDARAIHNLTSEIKSLGESNRRLIEGINNFGGTISEDIERLSSLEERIQYFISQGQTVGTE